MFVIPAEFGGRSERSGVKNREDRVVVLNDVANRVIDAPAWLAQYATAPTQTIIDSPRTPASYHLRADYLCSQAHLVALKATPAYACARPFSLSKCAS